MTTASTRTRVTDMRAEAVDYVAVEGRCRGTNLTYRVDGRPRSSRVPWVVSNLPEECARIERVLHRTGQ